MSNVAVDLHLNVRPFDDEHIVSTLFRHHFHSGYRTYQSSVSSITNDFRLQHPFQVNRQLYRDLYAAFSPRISYSEFLMQHTLYGYYGSFLPAQIDSAHSPLKKNSENISLVKFADEWRHCPACVEEDLQSKGCVYYHLGHQLPGMSICQKHQLLLQIHCEKCYRYSRCIDKVGLPQPYNCARCGAAYGQLDGYIDDDISWLQKTSHRLLYGLAKPLSLHQLQNAYRRSLNLEAPSGALRAKDIRCINAAQKNLDNHFSPQLFERLFNLNMDSQNRKFSGLGVYALAFHQKLHLPISHLMMVRMLFGEWENIPEA